MKKLIYFFAICMGFAACNGGSGTGTTGGDASLNTQMDSLSYAMGVDLSTQLKNLGIDLNGKELLKGFNQKDADPKIASSIIGGFSGELRERQGKPFTDLDSPKVNLDSLSFALGIDYNNRLTQGGIDLNGEQMYKGCIANQNNTSALDSVQIVAQMKNLTMIMQEKAQAKAIEDGIKNEAEGKAFLEANGQKDGVKTTASGLQYKVIKAGSGVSPTAENTVKVHYTGTLIDGTVFDSSVDRGEPIEFPLGGVIPGWTEGLQLMKPNAKYQFFIPYNLAYGERGSGPKIGPKATLIFDVELLEVK